MTTSTPAVGPRVPLTPLSITGAVILLALLSGIAVTRLPFVLVLGAIGATSAALILVTARRDVRTFFLVALVVILLGYAFFGRGFAYLFVTPVYVGELTLALGVLSLIALWSPIRPRGAQWFIVLFIAWGTFRTLPYVAEYELDALRDGAFFGYALFSFLIAELVSRRNLRLAARVYATAAVLMLLWIPVAIIVTSALAGQLPSAPGSPWPILTFKGGDVGVHLAGIAAFFIAGLGTSSRFRLPKIVMIGLWLLGFAIVGSQNRGGMMAAATGVAIAVVLSIQMTRDAGPRVLFGAIMALSIVSAVFLANPELDVGRRRDVTVQQVTANALSVFIDSGSGGLEGTEEWRRQWWADIVDYTVFGPYRWTGKGFGINLADDDGFQGTLVAVTENRSPHSAHFTVLARSGIPGLGLWTLVNVGFAVVMLRSITRSRQLGHDYWAGFFIWITAYWGAAMVNASFDVYLEGPQGGIWFWTIIGLGFAARRVAPSSRSDP